MPQIPRAVIAEVSPNAIQPLRYSGGSQIDFGGLAAKVNNGVNNFVEGRMAEQHKADAMAARDSLNQFDVATADYLNRNVFSKQGSAALGVIPQVPGDLEKLVDAHVKSLGGGPARKDLFTAEAKARIANKLEAVSRFQLQETERYDVESRKAEIANGIDSFAMDPSPENGAKIRSDMEHNLEYFSRGLGEEHYKKNVADHVSAMYSKAAENMGQFDARRALEFVVKNQGEFREDDYAKLKSKYQDKLVAQVAADQADGFVASNTPRVKVEEFAKSLDDPKKADMLLAEFDRRYAVKQALDTEAQQLAAMNGVAAVLRDPTAPVSSDLPAATQQKLRLLARDLANGDLKTDPKVYTALIQKTANPGKFAQENLADYARSLSKEDFTFFAREQAAIKKGKAPGQELVRMRSINSQVIDAFGDKAKQEKDPEDFQMWLSYMDDVIAAIPKADRTEDRIQAEIKKANESVVVNHHTLWFDKTEPRYKVNRNADEFGGVPSILKGRGAQRTEAGTFVVPAEGGGWNEYDAAGKFLKGYKPKQ